jgi:superkiller protein 3
MSRKWSGKGKAIAGVAGVFLAIAGLGFMAQRFNFRGATTTTTLTSVENDGEKIAAANQTTGATLAQKNIAIAYLNLGLAFAQQTDWKNAETAFQKAISLDPSGASAYSNLGNALDKQGKIEEAIAVYQKAISLNPSDVYAYSNLGIALYNQGKTEEAIAAY